MEWRDNVIWDVAGLTCNCWTGTINVSVRSWLWLSEEMRYWRRLMYNQPCSLSGDLPPERVEGHSCCFLTLSCSCSVITCKLPPPALSSQNFPTASVFLELVVFALNCFAGRLQVGHIELLTGRISISCFVSKMLLKCNCSCIISEVFQNKRASKTNLYLRYSSRCSRNSATVVLLLCVEFWGV